MRDKNAFLISAAGDGDTRRMAKKAALTYLPVALEGGRLITDGLVTDTCLTATDSTLALLKHFWVFEYQ